MMRSPINGWRTGLRFATSTALVLLMVPGLAMFYGAAVAYRGQALVHKHCMIAACIAIMDPGIARIALSLGVSPLIVTFHHIVRIVFTVVVVPIAAKAVLPEQPEN